MTARGDRARHDATDCAVCGWPVDLDRGTVSPAMVPAHQACVRRWATHLWRADQATAPPEHWQPLPGLAPDG